MPGQLCLWGFCAWTDCRSAWRKNSICPNTQAPQTELIKHADDSFSSSFPSASCSMHVSKLCTYTLWLGTHVCLSLAGTHSAILLCVVATSGYCCPQKLSVRVSAIGPSESGAPPSRLKDQAYTPPGCLLICIYLLTCMYLLVMNVSGSSGQQPAFHECDCWS